MAKKQNYLNLICTSRYGTGFHTRLSGPELKVSAHYDDIMEVYRRLGGILPEAPTRVGAYDIDTPDFIIELDEENHFNRYRLCTLDSGIYSDNCNFDVESYKGFCSSHESNCLTYGKYANNDSTDKQFGASCVDGNLSGISRTRWKQRAFYDYIKDVTSIITGTPIIRISVYDKYKGLTIESLINSQNRELLLEYIEARLQKVQ